MFSKVSRKNVFCFKIMILYYDDTVLISNSSIFILNCLNDFVKYCRMWQLNICVNKTKSMLYTISMNPNCHLKISYTELIVLNTPELYLLEIVVLIHFGNMFVNKLERHFMLYKRISHFNYILIYIYNYIH